MPEFGISGAKRPTKSVQRYSGLDMTVFHDIDGIIEIDEAIMIYLPENSKRNNS
jgi:hypothetical protein